MVLEHRDITHLKFHHVQHLGGGVGWSKQQLILGILRHIGEGSEVCFRFESKLLGFVLSHDESS